MAELHSSHAARRSAHRFARFLCALTSAVLLCTLWAGSAPAAVKKVRVGYYNYGNFMSLGPTGEYEGYCLEYLQQLAKYTDWSYDVVDCQDWETAQQMLQNGQIDLLPGTYSAPERAEQYLFPDLPMCSIYTTLNTRPTDYRYYYEDFPSYNGMRVGVIRGSKDADNFARYCEDNHFSVETVPYLSTDEALQNLESGNLDAVAITHLGRSYQLRSIAQFSSEPIYVAVAANRTDLLRQLNEAQGTLKLHNPDYESTLYKKYFSVSVDQKPVFTRSEHDYLADLPEVKAVYDSSWAPLTFTDPDTGELVGIVADLFAQISKDTGLSFRFIPASNYQEALRIAQSDEADLLCAMTSDYQSNQRAGITATQNFIRIPVVLVSDAQSRSSLQRLGALQGYLGDFDLTLGDPSRSITYYASPSACFEALRLGELDGVYINNYTADYMLSQDRYRDLSVTTLTNHSMEVSIGISSSANPRLFSTLDKSIHFIASEQMDTIILKNSIYPQDITWRALIRQHPVAMFLGVVGVAGLVILLLSALLVSKSRSNRKIQGILYRDTLTGLLNLNKFTMESGQLLKNAENGCYAIVYIDIKQFKAINDTRGFAEGDAILCATADVLRAHIAPGELCARISADHFALLLCSGDTEELKARCSAIGDALNLWAEREGKPYHLVLAFGVYLVDEAEEGDVSLMMDLANYARRSVPSATHKSHVVLYDAAMRKTGLHMRDLSDRMQSALDAGEFVPYYQPKVDMGTGALVGSEALVRWRHPGKGLIPPGEFIPYFEKNGFVLELDLYVYECSCKTIRRWLDEGHDVKPVSCNFSRLHTSDERFPDKLMEIADRHGVPHSYLELEVTESVFMRDIEHFTRQFDRIKAAGFHISIDDFGSGYSSLGLLQRFPVDVIKLDRSFIREGIQSAREQVVLRSVVSMAQALGVTVICEGVETLAQAKILQKLGCRLAQGFYFAKPMPLNEFERLWFPAGSPSPV